MRLLYGLDRLPAGLSPDDERLPAVSVGVAPLRFNSEPMPSAFFPRGEGGHPIRVADLASWLDAACGTYAPYRRRFIAGYLAFVSAHLERHRAELSERLRRFDGLFAIEDFFWSAWRPLPRAWLPSGAGRAFVDFAFWDGQRLFGILLGEESARNDDALRAAGVAIHRVTASELSGNPAATLEELLPQSFRRFWSGEVLPMSPFRRQLDD